MYSTKGVLSCAYSQVPQQIKIVITTESILLSNARHLAAQRIALVLLCLCQSPTNSVYLSTCLAKNFAKEPIEISLHCSKYKQLWFFLLQGPVVKWIFTVVVLDTAPQMSFWLYTTVCLTVYLELCSVLDFCSRKFWITFGKVIHL